MLHVEHGLHKESEAHADFVAEIAAGLGLACETLSVRFSPGDSLEASAREARYEALTEAAERRGLRFVATAHTHDDQGETVLMRMMRGGSLGGIAPSREIFVRPLLGVRRSELREWLVAEGCEWREDPTNSDLRFERNWTRNVLLPLLRERREGIDDVLARTAERARDDEEVLSALAHEVLSRVQTDDVGILIDPAEFDAQPPAIRARVIIGALRMLDVDPRQTDIEAILERPSRHVCGPVSVWSTNEGLAFVREPVSIPERVVLGKFPQSETAWGIRVRTTSRDAEPWQWRCSVPGAASTLSIRSRRPGDRVLTSVGTKKVQDVLVDAKVPRPLRDLVPILATPDEALAVVGLTQRPEETATVIDVAPSSPSWSQGAVWNRI